MSELLESVKARYLTSRDFNGFYVSQESAAHIPEAIRLVKSGLVQVVSEEDYPNPHIRPWPSRRSIEAQVKSLEALIQSQYGLCLYPTPEAVSQAEVETIDAGEPFRRALAAGQGTLELAYFEFEVLEPYRNDPKFIFQFRDFGAETLLSDESHMTADEKDSIIMSHIGYAYDLSNYELHNPTSKLVRRACAFLGDLAKLHPVHQMRWKTFEVAASPDLEPHPAWWAQQMGRWPERIGPFQRFFFELETWNEFHTAIYGAPILRTTARPREFGWMIRPSKREFDAFIVQLDQLLSDNILHRALDELGADRKDADENNMGSLRRLETAMVLRGATEEEAQVVLKPFKDVRKLRQKPAHAQEANVVDNALLHKQVSVLQEVTKALYALRAFWQSHRTNREWTEPSYVAKDPYPI